MLDLWPNYGKKVKLKILVGLSSGQPITGKTGIYVMSSTPI